MAPEEKGKFEEFVDSLSDEEFATLRAWLARMQPEDYDAPGSTAREAGV